MEAIALLDTHVVVWLYIGDLKRFPKKARETMESHVVAISPIVELELSYLNEIGRLTVDSSTIIGELASQVGLRVENTSYKRICKQATMLNWTRDPFDRLLAAHAMVEDLPLITKDELLLSNVATALWD